MTDERIIRIIEGLELVQGRRLMFTGANTSASMSDFLSGFQLACQTLGLRLPYEMRQQAKEERGWPRSAEVWSASAMREKGLTDEAIADEMIAIDLGAWRRMAEQNVV